MKITIIGSGCSTCESLYNRVKKLIAEGKIDAKIEYIKDVNELVKRGIAGSPALLVNDIVVHVGLPESEKALLDLIKQN